MEDIQAKFTAIKIREKEIEEEKERLREELCALDEQKRELEAERLKRTNSLSSGEESALRAELRAVGKLFEMSEVHGGILRVIAEDPSPYVKEDWRYQPTQPWKINLLTRVGSETGPIGLTVCATVLTLSPHVEAVVRSLFKQEGYTRDKSDLVWEQDWDCFKRIVLVEDEKLNDA